MKVRGGGGCKCFAVPVVLVSNGQQASIIVFFKKEWQIRQHMHYLGAQRFWQKSTLSEPISMFENHTETYSARNIKIPLQSDCVK
jgi:hypothetical protein